MDNVISIKNAHKREHGDNHWLWAVWINVDHKGKLNDQAPVARGFSPTKTKARRAAWAALREHIADKKDCRAYFNSWAFDLLRKDQENDTRPSFSRCPIGKNKWLWVVGEFEATAGSGIAESQEAAQDAAELQFGSVRHIGNWMAECFREKQIAIERSQKTSEINSTTKIELVYECHHYDGDCDAFDSITPYRIVKRTKTRIYVDREEYREQSQAKGDWTDYLQRTFVLDRAEFETTGKTRRRSRSWSSDTFYATPDIYLAERRSAARPECFVVLGVEFDANEADVKQAFKRLAKKSHPDAGGDPEQFKAVYAAYERAMELLASRI